jgi:hypothetical protein
MMPPLPNPTLDLGFPSVLDVGKSSRSHDDTSKEEDDTRGCRRRQQKQGFLSA